MHNPLEQFAIKRYLYVQIGSMDLSFTNSALMLLLVFGVVLLFWYFTTRKGGYRMLDVQKVPHIMEVVRGDEITERHLKNRMIPGYVSMVSEYVYDLVCTMTKGSAGERSDRFVPFIFSLYVFIILCNLLGLVPGGYTATSSIAVTFALSASMIIVFTIIGFLRNGWGYLGVFVPHGTPVFMAPLIFIIELFAYLARPISLALRLSANMTAGHIILKVVASLILMAGIFGVLPFTFLVIMTGFEVFIAVLQAYIFSILACVYLSDVLEPH